jgi:hypothetical protein
VVKDSQLSVIIAWRIASYHIPLLIMWIALMKLTIGKVSLQNTNTNVLPPPSFVSDENNNNSLSEATAGKKKNVEEHSDDKK